MGIESWICGFAQGPVENTKTWFVGGVFQYLEMKKIKQFLPKKVKK
jgi:hypothetical protein